MKFSFIVTINTCMQHKWEKCSPLHLIYFFRPVNACAQLNVYRGLRNQYHEVCFIYYFKLNDVCLFGFFPLTWEFFTHMETSTLPVKGFKFLTYAWQSLPLSSEGSLACNMLWHGASVYNGHLQGPMTLTTIHCREFSNGAVAYTYFYDLGLSRLGSNTQPSACKVNALTDCPMIGNIMRKYHLIFMRK